jgi:ribosomal protein S13
LTAIFGIGRTRARKIAKHATLTRKGQRSDRW